MARHRTTVPTEHFHSDDPRQTDLEDFIAKKEVRRAIDVVEDRGGSLADAIVEHMAPGPTAGRPAVPVASTPSQIQAPEPLGDDVDALAREIVRVTGFAPSLFWSLPGSSPASRLVRLAWESLPRALRDGEGTGRQGFFASSGEALLHAIEYERIDAELGSDAAEAFHNGVRCRTEAEAVAEMIERSGVDSELARSSRDVNRNNKRRRSR